MSFGDLLQSASLSQRISRAIKNRSESARSRSSKSKGKRRKESEEGNAKRNEKGK
jgi:hypothetical protein